jgi:hypothetical protein
VSREPRASLPARWLRAFGAFWWDFLVGDTPELLLGVLIAMGVVAVLVRASSLNAAAVAGLPIMVVLLLSASLYYARRQSQAKRPKG